MFSFLSGERKENQKRKPGTRPAVPLRPPVSGAWFPRKYFAGLFFEKPRREKTENARWGRTAPWNTFIPLPDKVSFLWFFLFFS